MPSRLHEYAKARLGLSARMAYERVREQPDAPVSRTLPPARRAAAMRRAHGCCEVPGCRAAVWVDLHHWRFRSRGGDHALKNLVALCSAHHRAVHDGHLLIDRDPRGARFVYRHRDGRPYGSTAPVAEEQPPAG